MMNEHFSKAFADESPEIDVPPPALVTPTTPTVDKLSSTPSGRSRTEREQRSGNTLYQELSFQDADALGEMDEGADITGKFIFINQIINFNVNLQFFFVLLIFVITIAAFVGSWVHPGEYASSGMFNRNNFKNTNNHIYYEKKNKFLFARIYFFFSSF